MLGAGDDRKMKGMISLVLECIDRLHVYSSAAHFADIARREAKESWKSILNSLYELLGKQYDWIFKARDSCIFNMIAAITAVLSHTS
ncbi:Ryanodine receptor 2 [Camelus dromedarius]|uniref:Ryanodine receptor 2 n=1 Tax=Camelus dromedarius TaxID=9838 RepID=A0A5N4CT85_CAMDR|nr:Ryanodine receptor 2 [Camelus dromedarius]